MFRAAFSFAVIGRSGDAPRPPQPPSPRPSPLSSHRLSRRAILRLVPFSPLIATTVCARAAADGELPRSEAEWRERLTEAQFYVLREHGTERPFTSALNDEKRRGTFCCAGCGAPVFPSEAKFNSGTGWPSFTYSVEKRVRVKQSFSDRLLLRKEISCARCGGHLGHVFEDGPAPTGLRYCINGVALSFSAL